MNDGSFETETYLVLAANGSLLLLAAAAFIFYRRTWLHRAVPVIVFLAYYTAGHMALIAQARNSMPIAPYVMLFATHTVVNELSCF